MLLLDIMPIRVPDTTRVIPKPIIRDTVSVPSDTTDTVTSSAFSMFGGNQADIAPLPPKFLGLTGDDFTTLLWAVIAVLAALSLCFYFVKKYRKA
jgi:hypothetical protein